MGNYFKNNIISLWTSPCSKMGLQYQMNLPYFTEVQWDIYDLPFVRSKGYHYQASHLDIMRQS